jgi:proline iminopeptidase
MARLFPATEPYDHGRLDVGDGNTVYWEQCGNPHGKPAVVLHGGPGSGCTPLHRRWFDPTAYRTVLFDQRNCGRSTPHASEPRTNLHTNTTARLVGDIERLREHLGIERWLVWGNSWGTTLALAYAETHPDRVSEVVLVAVGTTSRAEIEWLSRGAGRFLPEQWERFRAGVPAHERDGDLVGAYARLLTHTDHTVRERAARAWCDWEDALVAVNTNAPPDPRYADAQFRLGFARIVTHYFSHGAWLEEGALLEGIERLHGIPAVLVHGRFDLGSPLEHAWRVARAWAGSELVVVATAGHSTGDPGMADAVLAATDRFARV